MSKCFAGLPLGRSARRGFLKHLVDLLKSKTLCLRDEEVGVDECAGTETTPHEEDGRLEIAVLFADHIRSDDGDDLLTEIC